MVQLPGLSSPWDDKADHEDQPPGSTGEQGLIEPSPSDRNPAQVTPEINALPSSSTSEPIPGVRPGPNKCEIQDPDRRRDHTTITGHGHTEWHYTINTIIVDEGRGQLFACPYFKHDPTRYGTKEWNSCGGPGWEIHRLKEHLRRVHRQKGHKCNCCLQRFPTHKQLFEHQRSDVRCEPMDDVHDDSIDDTQWGKMQERNRGMQGEAEWREIYKTIFPLDKIPSPYRDLSGELEAVKLPSGDTVMIDRDILLRHAKLPADTNLGDVNTWLYPVRNEDSRSEEPWVRSPQNAPVSAKSNDVDQMIPRNEFPLTSSRDFATEIPSLTDSGYGSNSKLESLFQLDKLHEVTAAESVDITDSATHFSETPSLLDPRLQEYTTAFAGDLADLIPRNSDAEAVERLLASLPDLLKEFATNITFDGDTSHHENLMYFVYKHNSSIVQHVRERFAKSFNQDSENEMPREQSDNPPWSERIAMLLGREHPESTPHDMIPTENEDYDEDANEDPESLQIAVHRDVLARSSAYECLVARIRGELLLEVPGTIAARNEVRDYVSKAIGRPKRISRKDKSVYHEIEFDVEWDPLGFHREQAYEESPSKALEGAITITGSGNNVQALTCLQYMTQTWPTSGPQLLRLLQDMVCNPGHPQTTVLSDRSTATALYSSADCKVRVAVSGSASSIAEVGEQLAWIGSALRSSPVAERIVCCRPEIHQVWLDHSKSMPSRATGEFLLRFHFSEHEDSGPAPASGANCWKNLFRNPVVVLGYPILRRPQANTGLEIPLAMMARLVNTQTLVDFCGRTFLKGFSAMVAVTEISAQAVFWHLFHNEYGSRISYEDPRAPQISDQAMVVDTTQLETGRHILGWCGDVENYAGAPDANYDVEWSRLSDPDQSCAFQNVSISGGKFINAGFNLAIGIKDKPAHISFAPDDYIGTLIALGKRHFVFCDVEAKRSWLINGTNALLHLLRAALKDYENNRHLQRLNLLLLDRSKLHEPEETHTSDAAFEFLANEHNLSLPLYKKSTETWTEKTTKLAPNDESEAEQVLKQKSTVFRLKDRIDQIIRFLEQVIAHQDNVRTQNGVGFRLKHTPRRQLEGFDFMDLATKLDTIWPKVATLSKSGRGWVDFTRAIHAVTLFGTGFGELLRPKSPASGCPSCQWNISLPEGEDHLAVCVTDLRSIIRTNGSMRRRPWRLVNNIHWHVPDKAFEPCNCSVSPKSGQCDRVQVLLPQSCRTLWTQVRSPEKLPDGDRGAVVFGHSWKFPLRWKSDGEPEEGQPAYDDDEEEGDSAFHDSGLGTSNEASSSGRSKPWSWSLPGRSPRTPTESSSGLYMQRNGPIVPSLCNDMKRGANDSEEGGTLDNGWPGPADGNEPKRGRWF